jgi:hypothetical protein
LRCVHCEAQIENVLPMWKTAFLSGAGGSLGFMAMGFLYPPLWLGVPGCRTLGLLLGRLGAPLCPGCRELFD